MLWHTAHRPNLTKFILVTVTLCATLAANGQRCNTDSLLQRNITLGKLRTTAYEALNRITDSTGLLIVYDSRTLASDRKVRLSIDNIPLIDALNQITADSTLCYKSIGKHIIIFKPGIGGQDENQATRTDSLQSITLRGRVLDAQTRKPIPYVAVGIARLGLGNVTNTDGLFALKLPGQWVNQNLVVSHIGYRTKNIPIGVLAFEPIDILLEVEYVSIQEVIIRKFDPNRIVLDFIERIPLNYPTEPTYLTAFYREGVRKGDKLLNYSEGVFKIYKAPYNHTNEGDMVKVLKSRKLQNANPTDTLNIKLKGGIGSALLLDLAKNIDNFFSPEVLDLYSFSRSDIVSYRDRMAFAVHFEQKEYVLEPLLMGTLFIDIQSLALVGAEFMVNPKHVERFADQLVVKRNRRFLIKPEKVSYKVGYSWINNRCYLAHVRGDLQFKYRKRNQLFSGRFHAFLEMATSQIDTLNATRFDRKEAERLSSIFSDTPNRYDALFWKDFNFIPPEENLYEALKRMNWNIESVE
jgi:hypothetical protein